MPLFFQHFSTTDFIHVLKPFDSNYNLLLASSLALSFFILVLNYNQNPKGHQNVLKATVLIIVILELMRQVWAFALGQYRLDEMLPLHLCGIQVILMPLMLKTKSPYLQNFVYLTALPGALAALLFNETVFYKYPIWHFQTIQTFIIHSLIFLVPLYMMIYDNFRPQMRYLKSSIYILGGIALFNTVVNYFTKGNYLFIAQAPVDTPIAWVEAYTGWPGYIPVMFGIVILIWIIMIGPFEMLHRSRRPVIVGDRSTYRFKKRLK